MITAKQQLLELKYMGDLWADIDGWLVARMSWREIRHEVERRSGLQVSHESLRTWHNDRQRSAA